ITGHKDEYTSHATVDSGASQHLVNDGTKLRNVQKAQGSVQTAGGEKLRITAVGEMWCQLINSQGERVPAIFHNVALVPGLSCDLISVKAVTDRNAVVKFSSEAAYLEIHLPKTDQVPLRYNMTSQLWELP
ncbi:unnamed protein product, partial [Phaeothamnion confervicola]